MIRAEVIADSISPAGHRLTTMQVSFPRCILAEVNTHRAFSRNSASSRAVPVRKMIEQARDDPFIPLRWQRAQTGMQGVDLRPGDTAAILAKQRWLRARDAVVEQAEALLELGLHKTMPNRLLEPFMWHTAIISGTDWDGFWAQRCSPLAEIHMEATANAMRAAYNASTPLVVDRGWHLPYIGTAELEHHGLTVAQRMSAARCARVSYLTHDGRRSAAEDLALYDRLVAADPPHWSPLEHQATPAPLVGRPQRGNFTGWLQLRHEIGGAR